MNTRIWILVPMLLALAACGGGGGGGGSNAGDDNTGTPPPPPTANNAPTIGGTPANSVTADDPYSFVPQAADADADTLTFSIANQPFWASFNSATGELSGVPLNDQAGEYEDIVISVSDGEDTVALPAFTLLVLPVTLGRDNFKTEGNTFPTDDGYRSVGTLILTVGDREQRFEESDLTVTFDDNGDLADMNGETVLPPTLADNVIVDTPARAIVDVMTGAEIYADPDLDILLLDERKYIVYYLRAGIDLIITDPDDGTEEILKIETPLAGEILLIVDPTDPMYYIFGSQPLIGERGEGKSLRGLIPFEPELPFEELDSFNGHLIDNGSFGFSIKNIDVLDIEGTRVFKLPSPLDIDFSDPFNSPVEYRMGMNGSAALGLGVFGFGLLDIADAQMSGTIDVGLDRQSMAMQTIIEPAENWLPDWIPMRSETEINGEWLINGEGEYVVDMTGRYKIFLPEIEFEGGIRLDNRGATLSATLGAGARQFTMTSDFESDRMPGFVEIPPGFSEGLGGEITAAVDEQIAVVESTFQDLENAIADYEFEVSLRGLREQLPGISDQAVSRLEGVPGTIRSNVRSAALNFMKSRCIPVTGPCIDAFVDENAVADSIGNVGRSAAEDAIRPIVGFMRDLKTQAQQADDAALRQALEDALRTAARYQTLNRRITVTHDFGDIFGALDRGSVGLITLYNNTFSQETMPAETANRLIFAADNVYRIGETDSIRISTQQIFDALPVREALDTVKQEVADGVAQIPTVEGVGFTLFTSGFEAVAIIDGDEYPVEFNFFDPEASAVGLGKLLATQLIDAKN